MMKIIIHRGTKEIGGTCVEVWTDRTRILIDFGMPLVNKDGSEFVFDNYKKLTVPELINQGILPDISGLYDSADSKVDAVLISHAHKDHFGLSSYISKNVKFYLGKATHRIIELNNLFTGSCLELHNVKYFSSGAPFQVGDIAVTPYLVDHSAFDSYSFLIKANGKSLFYSGDFRSHGRKAKVFKWFKHNAPKDVDYLLLEGTSISRTAGLFQTESDIERTMENLFREENKINLVYTSGQNIDRIVSILRACVCTGKIMVVDVYVASVLKELSKFACVPFPPAEFNDLRVMFPYYTSTRLARTGNKKVLYQFKSYKITKKDIGENFSNIVMLVRPSLQKDLERIEKMDGGNFIYSVWEGYFNKPDTKRFIDYLIKRNFCIHKVHTSGHADISTLKELVEAVKPKCIVPIHTFCASEYKNIFSIPVLECSDGEVVGGR